MKRMIRFLTTGTGLLALTLAAAAQQAPPPQQPEPPKPKAKKVWSNEDIGTVRRPSDDYEDAKRKEADDAAAKQKAAAEASAAQPAGEKPAAKPKDYLPKTAEEAEKRLAAKQYEIGQQYDAIDLVKKEQAQATTDESRAAFQKRIDTLTATLEESIAEMHKIDGRLQEVKANPPASSAAAENDAASEIADIQKQMEEKQQKIVVCTEQIQQLRDAVATASSEMNRASLQKKLDGFVALQEKTNGELKDLDVRLQEAKSKPPAPPKPEPPKP
jgi:chromosome segregation ATPase